MHEDFENMQGNSSLPENATTGWRQDVKSKQAPQADSAHWTADAAYDSSMGLSIGKRETVVLYERSTLLWTKADGPVGLKMNLRINGDMPLDIILHNGSTSAGMRIGIDSAKKTLSVSEAGGTSVFRAPQKDYAIDGLKAGVWYTLEIRNIHLSSDKNSPAEGKLYLYESEHPAKVLLEGVTISSSGGRAFDEIGVVQVRRWGRNSYTLDIDNISLSSSLN
jgi:hypothetical protein